LNVKRSGRTGGSSKASRRPPRKRIRGKQPLSRTASSAAPRKRKAAPVSKAKGGPDTLLALVLARLDDNKAAQTVTIDMRGKSSIADFMVVTSGRSSRHVGAIAKNLVDQLEKSGAKNVRVEGMRQSDWVLIDGGDVIVHVFRPEVREFYNLEKMWLRARPAKA
jgi:ribosome-associated protein